MIKKILIFKKEFIFQLLFVQEHKYVRVKPFFSSWSGPLVNQLYCTVVVVVYIPCHNNGHIVRVS